MSSSYAFVINPASRGGALGHAWSDMARTLRSRLGALDEYLTAEPGDGVHLAREAIRSGAKVVVAVGGDGTINEVVNGFYEGGVSLAKNQHLGILPFGTGGDLRRTLNISDDLEHAAALLKNQRAQTVDLGHVTYENSDGQEQSRYFINIASFGISGLVDKLANDSSKRLGGRASFLMASARATLSYRNKRVRLVLGENEAEAVTMNVHLVALANGRYFGGGMEVAPGAQLDDGKFDVVVAGDLTKLEVLKLGTRIYKGAHLSMDKISSRRAKSVRAETLDKNPVLLDIDGEAPGQLPATFRVVPDAISVIAPSGKF